MFHVLPDNFFVPLSSPNKTVYWDCICKLFSVMEHQLSFGVERDVLVDELEYYFDQAGAAQVVEEDFAGSDSRGKANGILRRLEYYGWVEVETDKSYVQRVNFKEYAVRLMKILLEIEEGRQMEYQGYIYTIYSLVRGGWENPGVVLLQILENTDALITGLKNLNSSIKHYIDDLTRYSNVPLRYNYDKPEKPRRIKGFEVFSLIFSSFSKPKNHTEISRIAGGVSLTTNE